MRVSYLLVLPVLAACDAEPSGVGPSVAETPPPPAAAENPVPPQNPWGFAEWRADFPFPIHASPAAPSANYDFTKKQALERVVARLQGNSTREGWLMAKEFFRHAPAEAVPLLIDQLDRALPVRHQADLVENTIEALGALPQPGREVGEALLRGLQHSKESVQSKAMAALVVAGNADAVRQAEAYLDSVPLRAVADWLRAVRAHWPEQAATIFGRFLRDARYGQAFGPAVEETVKLPKETALQVLEPMWEQSRGSLRGTIANVLHANGDLRGTHFLQELLRKGDPTTKANVLKGVRSGSLEHLLDDVLKLSVDEDPSLRQAVVLVIADHPGENIDNVLSAMAMDEATEVRQPALAALRARGKRDHIDRLIDRVRTDTGTMLIAALADLSTIGDGVAIAAMRERLRASPPEEARKFIQAIGRSSAPEAFEALVEVLQAPEGKIDSGGTLTNVTYAGLLLPNQRGSAASLLELAGKLSKSDYRRRAVVLHALGNLAGVTDDPAFARAVFDLERAWWQDPSELPQLRLLALEYLRRDLTLDDMEVAKRLAKSGDGPMRRAMTDFLFEFF